MKHSIRRQMIAFFVTAMAVSFAVIAIINYGFLAKFYHSQKIKTLKSTYAAMNEIFASESDDYAAKLMQISVQDNIEMLVEDEGLESMLFSTSREARDLELRLFGYYTGFYREKIDVLEETNMYAVQETSDRSISISYLEMWGQFDNGYCFLMRTPLEAIENAVHLSNMFYLVVGSLVVLVSVVFISLFSKRLTKPIVTLTDLSQRMANLDFEAKYGEKAGNEIDMLGENFNRMSDELKDTVSELKNANNEEKIDEMRIEFLNNVSHELKTPIALIQGYAEGLKDDICDDKESRDFYVDVILDEAGKMNKMVRQLLSLNQLEFGQNQVQMERFDLTALIQGVIDGMKLIIGEKGACVTFDRKDPVYVWGDEFKIEESISKLWEKFYKVDKARTRAYGGSGIGLSIVKAIMEGHHQKCGVRNYDDGVAFWFTLDARER